MRVAGSEGELSQPQSARKGIMVEADIVSASNQQQRADAVYTYTFDNLNDALARVSRFLTPGNLFDERVEVDPTGFKETIRIETIQVWLGEANEEGTEIAKDLGYWKFKSKLGE